MDGDVWEMTIIELSAADETRIEEFAGSLFMAALATVELANVELGVRLGLYEALAGAGPATAAELASSAGVAERYARVRNRRLLRVTSRGDPSVWEMAAGRALVTARGQIPVIADIRGGSARPRSSSVLRQCRGVSGRDPASRSRWGDVGVSGERHAASASRTPVGRKRCSSPKLVHSDAV